MAIKKPIKVENFFDIHSLIAKGKEDVREYKLPVGTVLIRPLTDIEMEECEMSMLDEVKDPATREFAFNSSPDDITNVENEHTRDVSVNYSELIRASTKFMLMIAYMAMKDFTDDFEIDDLKKLDGIKDLALEVQRISGYSDKTIEQVEEFR